MEYTVTAVVGRSLSVVVVVFVVVGEEEEQSMARWCVMSDSRVVQLDTEVARKKCGVFFLGFFLVSSSICWSAKGRSAIEDIRVDGT